MFLEIFAGHSQRVSQNGSPFWLPTRATRHVIFDNSHTFGPCQIPTAGTKIASVSGAIFRHLFELVRECMAQRVPGHGAIFWPRFIAIRGSRRGPKKEGPFGLPVDIDSRRLKKVGPKGKEFSKPAWVSTSSFSDSENTGLGSVRS